MAYDTNLADRIRTFLLDFPGIRFEEKKQFRGLTFMINGKMCINVSGENLMCRFDPALQEVVAKKKGFETMVMKGKAIEGYCYVKPSGFELNEDFEYWMNLCLGYNERAKLSKKAGRH
jgi:hypothetical protein